MKKDAFERVNPNGRAPAIEDPNTGITIWESVAIIEYLVETYDKEETFTYTASPEKWKIKQWLYYQVKSNRELAWISHESANSAVQMSGQGPYFGQASWFILYHDEK